MNMSLPWRITLAWLLVTFAIFLGLILLPVPLLAMGTKIGVATAVSGALMGLSYWVAASIISPVLEVRNSELRSYQELTTRLQEAREELRDEKEKTRAMLSRLADGIIITDDEGRIALFNQAAERIFGLPATETLGKMVNEACLTYSLSDMLQRALRHGVSQTGELQLQMADSVSAITLPRPDRQGRPADEIRDSKWVEAFVTRVESDRGRGYGAIIVLHDRTQMRRLENVRRDFVANVSHELRTPIAAIRAMAETLLSARDDPEIAPQFLETIIHESERLSVLLNDLLELARIESPQFELEKADIAAGELLQEVARKVRTQAESRRIQLTTRVESDFVFCANRESMQQILLNLLDNAIKYTSEQGTVECRAAADNGETVFTVRDSGMGIPRKDLPRIFERFYRVDKARARELGGTGLGLSIVKHLVEVQGGEVSVESEQGKGSTFKVSLPGVKREE